MIFFQSRDGTFPFPIYFRFNILNSDCLYIYNNNKLRIILLQVDLITSTSVILCKSFFVFFDKLSDKYLKKRTRFTRLRVIYRLNIMLDHLLLDMYKLFPPFNITIRSITFIYAVYGKYTLEIIAIYYLLLSKSCG